LPKGTSASDFGLVPVAPGIGAIHLDPGQLDAFASAHPELELHVSPPRRPLLDRSVEWTHADSFRATTGADGTGVAVGIIDTGIDIAHPDFRNEDGSTRIAWLFTLEPSRGAHAAIEEELGCGTGLKDDKRPPCAVYSAADIDAILQSGETHALIDPAGHGTHVASIAAGNGGVMLKEAPRYVGVAPKATLLIASASRPDRGFDDADILNATRFIFDRAAAPPLAPDPMHPMPVVINLSVGSDFGPHDGSSDLEKGLASFVGDDKPGRAIVLAAGNSGGIYFFDGVPDALGTHTEVRVSPNADTRVPILAPGAKKGQGYVWITFRPGDEVSVGLEGPGGATWIPLIDPGDDRGYEGDGVKAGVLNNRVKDGSPITSTTNSAVVFWEGAWEGQSEFAVLLRGRGDAQLWVTALGDVSPATTTGLLFRKAMKQGTITVPASHPSLLAVGCSINRLKWPIATGPVIELTSLDGNTTITEDSMCFFSSAGPTPFGVPKPELSAPGGFVAAAMSAASDPRQGGGGLFDAPGCPKEEKHCYVVDDRHAVTAGTSMSSPQVAGAIALLFQHHRKLKAMSPAEPFKDLTQAQVTAILQAGARRPGGSVPYDSQLGAGALDMQGALAALMDEPAIGAPPDVTRSWYVLSSEYARPDPAWPVWGTIELRRADGTVASGLDGSLLELEVEGGVVTQPITKIRHGLFRFSVAGEKGRGGTEITVRLAYDGQPLGTRVIPIGMDVWSANGGVSAVGGCWVSGEGVGAGWPLRGGLAGASAIVAAAVLAAARRRARRASKEHLGRGGEGGGA
jgi:subtilisin family serine protease